MDILGEAIAWFTDPGNWSGSGGIPNRVLEHVLLSGACVVVATGVGLPVGMAIGHTGRGALLAITLSNVGRGLPSFALLLMLFPFFGIGFATAFPALLLLTIPPILTNAYVGIRDVDRGMVEAGRGMGMTELQLLRRVELPIALPVILAGARIGAVQVVATATLAALVGGGALGRYIVDGFALQDDGRLVGGAILVALLAVGTERFFSLLERRVVSTGITGQAGPGRPRLAGGRPATEPAGP